MEAQEHLNLKLMLQHFHIAFLSRILINYQGQEKLNIKILIPCIKTRIVEIILFRNNYWYTVLVLGHKIGECMV